jgi:polysaccharide deacetylase family protein (PEP-CTERM system associated)
VIESREMHAQHRTSAPAHAERAGTRPLTNAFSVDVEDYFHVLAFDGVIHRVDWERHPLRAVDQVYRLLDLLDEFGVTGTFFVLAWVAERAPQMVPRIARAGHEVASHGCDHQLVTRMNPRQFRDDVLRSRRLLEQQSGQAVRGYRAPSYSINASNLWAHDVLVESGYHYSSSIFPGRHDIYGMPEAPRFAHRVAGGALLEVPVTTVEVAGKRLSAGGGGFFRLLPYPLFRAAVRRVNQADRQSAMFYLHPWEIDVEQPRIVEAPVRSRFRHYLNLHRVWPRLRRLLGDFRWDRVDRVFDVSTP